MKNQQRPMKSLGRAQPTVQQPLSDTTFDATPALEASTNSTESTPSSAQNAESDSSPKTTGQTLIADYSAQFPSIQPNGQVLTPVHLQREVLDGFTIFKKLSRDIQLMIWEEAVDFSPRNVPVGIMPQLGPGGFKFRTDIPIPEGFMACKDYYEAAKKRYCLLDGRLKANDMSMVQHLPSNFWFNPAIDRFCPVQEWSPYNFEIGLELFFLILQVSKIAISDYASDDNRHNGETWQKFFHTQSIESWGPHVKDLFYYITFERLNTDVELSFVPNDRPSEDPGRFYFRKLTHFYKHWDQFIVAKVAYKVLARFHAHQKWQDKLAEKEGRPRVKLACIDQWLFDVGSDWSLTKPTLMIETRTFTTHKPVYILVVMPQW
ncbi:hypothetical protein EAE96_006090 [Botrytis aclada]|nr:hypothetical protein EAE96_006090 [Botrytis aclada]